MRSTGPLPVCRGRYPLTVPFIVRFFNLPLDGRQSRIHRHSRVQCVHEARVRAPAGGGVPYQRRAHPCARHVRRLHSRARVPTVILLGRARRPRTQAVRAALGVRGEPAQSADPAAGVVWRGHHRADRTSGQRERMGRSSQISSANDSRHTPGASLGQGQRPADRDGNRNPAGQSDCPHRLLRETGSDDAFTRPPRCSGGSARKTSRSSRSSQGRRCVTGQ